MPYEILLRSLAAGILASLACGLGALPLLLKRLDLAHRTGIGYGFAGGLMLAASVYNLILPGLTMSKSETNLPQVLPVLAGILLGAVFLWSVDRYLNDDRLAQSSWKRWGNRAEILIFLAMSVHSIPEGVAVGVGYASEEIYDTHLGSYIALAIAIHNIPEGLAVAIPMRAAGASMMKCFWAAVLTSLPQPIAAVPAALSSARQEFPMQVFSKRQLAGIVDSLTEGMTEAGFTGISIARQDVPQSSLDALWAEEGDEDKPDDIAAFSAEIVYHRVKTDQGEFGFWLSPYPTLDISGLGLDFKAFLPADEDPAEVPKDWAFIGLHEDVFKDLFGELAKKRSQP